ncbi:MAG: sugar transferase [Planctomycetota bacterium]
MPRSVLEGLLHKQNGLGQPGRQTPLHRVLQRERARIDRLGGSISLLVFVFTRPLDPFGRRRKRLQRVLEQRVRLSDEIGVVDRHRVFVLLPDTTPKGAKVLARDVLDRMTPSRSGGGKNGSAGLDFVVYRYVSARGDAPKDSASANGDGPRRLTASEADRTAVVSSHRDDDDDVDRDHLSGGGSTGSSGGRAGAEDGIGRQTAGVSVAATAHSPQQGRTAVEDGVMPMCDLALGLPWWKRATDITLSATALVLLSPVLAAAALAIRLDTPGPVMFIQQRMGCGRRVFPMLKFRTMVQDAEGMRSQLLAINEQDGPAFKLSDDPRVTRVGRVLRATSVDELPQLVNVLLGHMTLVGPRPLPLVEAEAVGDWHERRHSVHPGLTCIWQVRGRSGVLFEDWARMDLAYIGQRSFWSDLKIILLTVPAVLKREGAK